MSTRTPTLVSTARMTQDDFSEWLGKIELLDGLVVCEPPAIAETERACREAELERLPATRAGTLQETAALLPDGFVSR